MGLYTCRYDRQGSAGPAISVHLRLSVRHSQMRTGFNNLDSFDPDRLALQLRFLRSSESIGHHDSEIVDDGYFDRDDAGALGVIAAGYQSADGTIIPPGARGCFGGLVPGRTTRR